MKPHPRIRKTVKWGGAAATAVLVVAWVGSGWWTWGWTTPAANMFVQVRCGYLLVIHHEGATREPSFAAVRRDAFRMRLETAAANGLSNGWALMLPFWTIVPAVCLCTGVAWRLDTLARRRARIGLCPKCDYDRTGLAAGAVCPECGAVPASSSSPP